MHAYIHTNIITTNDGESMMRIYVHQERVASSFLPTSCIFMQHENCVLLVDIPQKSTTIVHTYPHQAQHICMQCCLRLACLLLACLPACLPYPYWRTHIFMLEAMQQHKFLFTLALHLHSTRCIYIFSSPAAADDDAAVTAATAVCCCCCCHV